MLLPMRPLLQRNRKAPMRWMPSPKWRMRQKPMTTPRRHQLPLREMPPLRRKATMPSLPVLAVAQVPAADAQDSALDREDSGPVVRFPPQSRPA